jgi:hypothetical protein
MRGATPETSFHPNKAFVRRHDGQLGRFADHRCIGLDARLDQVRHADRRMLFVAGERDHERAVVT